MSIPNSKEIQEMQKADSEVLATAYQIYVGTANEQVMREYVGAEPWPTRNKIGAIKYLRSLLSLDLLAAKNLIEAEIEKREAITVDGRQFSSFQSAVDFLGYVKANSLPVPKPVQPTEAQLQAAITKLVEQTSDKFTTALTNMCSRAASFDPPRTFQVMAKLAVMIRKCQLFHTNLAWLTQFHDQDPWQIEEDLLRPRSQSPESKALARDAGKESEY